MTSIVRKPLRCFLPIFRNYCISKCRGERNFSFYFLKNTGVVKSKSSNLISSSHTRNLSSTSNPLKSNDSKTDERNGKDEKNRSVLDDEEFKSILNDFAKDFDVGSDSEQILEEIRESIEESHSEQTSSKDKNSPPTISSKQFCFAEKFKEFSDSDSSIIPSHEELLSANNEKYEDYISKEINVKLHREEIKMKRGISGVYDIEELIDVLRKENLADITAISVPRELHYCDYLVIATAMSPRHSKAVCEHVIKIYKSKKNIKDPFVVVEGEMVSDWKVIDMGNIVLHVFLEETRELYDIESLWLFDSAFDRGGKQKDDPLFKAIEEQMSFFNAINEPLPEDSKPKTI